MEANFYKKVLKEYISEIINEEFHKKVQLDDLFVHYFRYGDLEGFDVPKINDTKLNWMFHQVISMIDELKANGVNSGDYLNTSNWGYKPNGNLGIFDIGFGDYFEKFEVEPEDMVINRDVNMLDKIKEKLGIQNSEYVGGGMFGFAHDIGNNRILKITKDKSEAINSKKVIGKKLNHIANIFDVRRFILRDVEYYTIILEKLKTSDGLNEMYLKLENIFNEYRNKHLDKYIIDVIKQKNEVVGDFLNDMTTIGYEKTWEKWIDILRDNDLINQYDFNDISEISFWIKGSVTNNKDIDSEPPSYIYDTIKELIK